MSNVNHYDVLGVPRGCDQSLIDTVYKAMVKVFHPDVFRGDKPFAEEKLKIINEAYRVLGDVELRRAYDRKLEHSESSGATEEIYEDDSTDHQPFEDMYADEWRVVIEYFPDIENMYNSLKKINASLALSFKIETLSKKNYRDSDVLFYRLKRSFMIDKFGKNSDIHSLVMFAMGSGNRRFALELNRNLLILGEDEYPIILVKMFHTHREFCIENYPKCGFGHLINVNVADAERVHSNYEITTRTQVISHAFVKKNSLPYRFGKIIGSIFS